MAEYFEIDDVIDPADTRRWIEQLFDEACEVAAVGSTRPGKRRPNIDACVIRAGARQAPAEHRTPGNELGPRSGERLGGSHGPGRRRYPRMREACGPAGDEAHFVAADRRL